MVELGYYSLVGALVASCWAVVASLLGVRNRTRGLQSSAERGIVGATLLIGTATVALLYGLLTNRP